MARILAILAGTQLYGHERGNISAYRALGASGHSVHVASNAYRGGGDVSRALEELGIPHSPLPFRHQWSPRLLATECGLYLFRNVAAVVGCSRGFLRLAKDVEPDFILVGSIQAATYVWPALRILGVPLIWRVGDCAPSSSRFQMVLWREMARLARIVVCNSEYVADEFKALSGSTRSPCVIYNFPSSKSIGDDSDVDRPDGSEFGDRSNLSVNLSPLKLLFVGSIGPHKGAHLLIDVMRHLDERGCPATLDVVGGDWDGSQELLLRQKVESNALGGRVRVHGFSGQVSQFMKDADLLLVPSVGPEASGNVVVEAFAERLPVVVFPTGGLPEHVRHGVDGYVCAGPDSYSLADVICRHAKDLTARHEMPIAARSSFESRFGWTRFVHQWGGVFV